jgi:uncharacterized membrane protein YhaH (DUF805 family)
MGFVEANIICLLKFATFSGRASRSEFWWFTLFLNCIYGIAWYVDSVIAGVPFEHYTEFFGWAETATFGLSLLPSTAVTVRRLHDIGKSGWWCLICLTGLGIFVVLYWCLCSSQASENQYGSIPKGVEPAKSAGAGLRIAMIAGVVVVWLFLSGGIAFYVAPLVGYVPPFGVVTGDDLPDRQIKRLRDGKILHEGEEVDYFYAFWDFDDFEEGAILTKDTVIYYSIVNGATDVARLSLINISHIEQLSEGSFLEDSDYRIFGGMGARWEYITIKLSVENSGHEKFMLRLYENAEMPISIK